MRIRYKILLIVLVGTVGFSSYLLFNYWAVSRTAHLLGQIRDTYFPVLERSEANKARLPRIVEAFQSAVTAGEEDMVDSGLAVGEEIRAALAETVDYEPSLAGAVDQLTEQLDAYLALAGEISLSMINETAGPGELDAQLEQMSAAIGRLTDEMAAFQKTAYGRFTGAVEAAEAAGNDALTVGAAIGVVTIVALLIVGVVVAAVLTRSLDGVVDSLRGMASGEGDLTRRLASPGSDEIGELVRWFNQFVEKLHDIVANVASSTIQVAASAEELSAVATQAAANLNRQQSQTQKLARTADEMLQMIQQVSTNTSDAAQLAKYADEQASTGHSIVAASNDAINALADEVNSGAEFTERLADRAKQATLAVSVINEIASQTNLLSLNAAIEAARAGDEGSGFSVVAREVRTLASRTQHNTREIEEVVKRIQGGVKQATQAMLSSRDRAEQTLSQALQVSSALEAISEAVSSIKTANEEVDDTVGNYRKLSESAQDSIVHIKDATDAAAGAVNQISSASGELATLAGQLQSLVDQFTISPDEHGLTQAQY
ncbi:MAG: methyl-accepting chemotaxis protein [Gammaproteobacteria bacterium]